MGTVLNRQVAAQAGYKKRSSTAVARAVFIQLLTLRNKTPPSLKLRRAKAVREGFEPSVQFPVRQFSKLILSASQAPHQSGFFNLQKKSPFFRDCKYSNSVKRSKKKLS